MTFKRGKPTAQLKKVGAGARHRHDRLLPARPDDLPEGRVRRRDDPRAARGRQLPAQAASRSLRRRGDGDEGRPSSTRRASSSTCRRSSPSARQTPVHEPPFTLERRRRDGLRLELALQWTESTDEHVRSYVNGIPTGSGGTHENGLRAGVGKAVRNYIETHNLSPKGVTLTAEDIREGLIGVLSVFIARAAVPGADQGPAQQPRGAGDGRRRWCGRRSSTG